METEEEQRLETTKRQNIDVEGQLVEVTEPEVKKKQGKVKGPTFQVQEYEFSKVPKTPSDNIKSISELYEK